MRRPGWLQEVLDDARSRLDGMPEWRVGDDVMREIRRLKEKRAAGPMYQIGDDDDVTG